MNVRAIRASRAKDRAARHLNLRGHRHVFAMRPDCFQNVQFTRETTVDFGKTDMPSVTAIAHFNMPAQSASL
jgi:hypothetical protein